MVQIYIIFYPSQDNFTAKACEANKLLVFEMLMNIFVKTINQIHSINLPKIVCASGTLGTLDSGILASNLVSLIQDLHSIFPLSSWIHKITKIGTECLFKTLKYLYNLSFITRKLWKIHTISKYYVAPRKFLWIQILWNYKRSHDRLAIYLLEYMIRNLIFIKLFFGRNSDLGGWMFGNRYDSSSIFGTWNSRKNR